MKRAAEIEKVAVYARVSTKDGRQDTENQLIALREYCSKQGWEIAGEYVDHETGGTSRRPHFQKMFADARARKFDLVLFWSLDRLSREGVSAFSTVKSSVSRSCFLVHHKITPISAGFASRRMNTQSALGRTTRKTLELTRRRPETSPPL